MARAAEAWQVVTRGFTGLDLDDEALRLAPRLPAAWTRLKFRLAFLGGRLSVVVTREGTTVTADAANREPLPVGLYRRVLKLAPGETARRAAASGGAVRGEPARD